MKKNKINLFFLFFFILLNEAISKESLQKQINIKADKAVWYRKEKKFILKGNVSLINEIKLYANYMELLGEMGNIEQIRCENRKNLSSKMKNKNNKVKVEVNNSVMTAQLVIYHIKEKKIILINEVELIKKEGILHTDKLIYNVATQQMELLGKVQAKLKIE